MMQYIRGSISSWAKKNGIDTEEDFNDNYEPLLSGESYPIIMPRWCKETGDDYFGGVVYMAIHNNQGIEDCLGLYADEFDAWNLVHKTISENDLEIQEKPEYYYKRFFKLTVQNVNPLESGEPFYAKYDFENMKFDI